MPQETKKYLDKLLDPILEDEKKEYDNKLTPFSVYAEKQKEEAYKEAAKFQAQLKRAEDVLKNILEKEEKKGSIPEEALFRSCMKALDKLKESVDVFQALSEEAVLNLPSLQELAGIDWSFMDRAYQAGKQLIDEKRLEDAASVFLFLRYLNPLVFAYWFCEGCCLQELGKIPEAFTSYEMSIFVQPNNPYAFFQLACIFYQQKENDKCLHMLDACLERSNDPMYSELHKKVEAIKQSLRKKKAA